LICKNLLLIRFKFGDFESRATVVDLPTITESYKTKDSINFFKSNSINQMIFVHPNNERSLEECKNKQYP
jgi:TATA-binding protein-associated factor Taf7